ACVDWVVGFGADTPIGLIERLRPDVLAKGGDWALDAIVGAETVRGWGGRVVRLSLVAGEGTTQEIALIRAGASKREPGTSRVRRNARPRGASSSPPPATAGTRDRAARRSVPSRGRRRP